MSSFILASSSPRRWVLLTELGLPFRVVDPAVPELAAGFPPRELVRKNAERKAEAVRQKHAETWVLAADTVVTLNKQIYGKPENLAQARAFLTTFSGQTHEVVTGLALFGPQGEREQAEEVTRVTFRELSDEVITRYLDTVPVLDKAGGYALQEHGEWLIEKVEGSRSNVIGLPLELLRDLLAKHGLLS